MTLSDKDKWQNACQFLTNLPCSSLRSFRSKKIPSSLRNSVSHAILLSKNTCFRTYFSSLKSLIFDLISVSVNNYNAVGKSMR